MTLSNVSPSRDADLQAFLFAYIGIELNGSPLTVLSMLARLDLDPWAEAAEQAAAPRADTVDDMTRWIEQMPLRSGDLAYARMIARRLAGLLPSRPKQAAARHAKLPVESNKPKWVMLAVFSLALVIGVAFNLHSAAANRAVVVPISALGVTHGK